MHQQQNQNQVRYLFTIFTTDSREQVPDLNDSCFTIFSVSMQNTVYGITAESETEILRSR